MKKLLIHTSILVSLITNASFATEVEVLDLKPSERQSLKTPEKNEILYPNKKTHFNNTKNALYSDDDVFETSLGKHFGNFINNKVINNKFSKNTLDLEEE